MRSLEMSFQKRRGSNGENNEHHILKLGEIDKQLLLNKGSEGSRKGNGSITHSPTFKAAMHNPDS